MRTEVGGEPSSDIPRPRPEPKAGVIDVRDVWWLLFILGVTGAVLGKDITRGGLRSLDSPVHAMDGVLIHDWVAAGPSAWIDPMGFAVEQYAHYPSLSIGRHYPPGFAVVEAGFYAVFGISATTARLSVFFMGLLATAGVYWFMRTFTPRMTSALGAVILVTMPAVTHWGRQTMLELPTLAVMIWVGVALLHYLQKPSGLRLTVLLALTLLSVFFKQNAVFLIGAVAAALAAGAWRGEVPKRHCLIASILTILVPLGVWWSMSSAVGRLVSGYKTVEYPWSLAALSYYARELPSQVHLWILLAAVAGFVLSLRRFGLRSLFLAAWFVGCYAMVTLADCKQARFFFVGLFPFAIWAAITGDWFISRVPVRARAVLVVGVAVVLGKVAFDRPVEYYPDHGPVVVAHRDEIENHAVLFSGLRDGDFVFAVRQHIPWRRTAVIRASKLLYTCTAHPVLDFESRVSNFADIEAAIKPLGLNHLFVERENRLGVREDELFRAYLSSSGDYRVIDSRRLREEPEPNYRNATMDVYEASRPAQRTVEYLDIPVPRANRTVRVDLSKWSS